MEKYCPQQGQPERGDIVVVAEALSQVSQASIIATNPTSEILHRI